MSRGEWVYDSNTWRALVGTDVGGGGGGPPVLILTPPTVFNVSAMSAGSGNTTKAWPAGHQLNDVAVIIEETANHAATLSIPAGFVEGPSSPQGTGTADSTTATRLTWWWKRAAG